MRNQLITDKSKNNLHMSDGFQRIAHVFRMDCEKRLRVLQKMELILASSETIADAMRIFFSTSSYFPEDDEQITSIPRETMRLRNCIEATEVRQNSSLSAIFEKNAHCVSLVGAGNH